MLRRRTPDPRDRYTWRDTDEQLTSLRKQKAAGQLSLTSRQQTILHSLLRGLTNKQIAEEQHLTVNTVEKDLVTLRYKFGAVNRAQLLAFAKDIFPEAFRGDDGQHLTSGSAAMQ